MYSRAAIIAEGCGTGGGRGFYSKTVVPLIFYAIFGPPHLPEVAMFFSIYNRRYYGVLLYQVPGVSMRTDVCFTATS